MLRKPLILASALFLLWNPGASAQTSPLWKKVGHWQIRVDRTLNFGCFMLASYTRGTVVRIGLDQQNRNGYILVGNKAWQSLQVGKRYEILFQFDDEKPWKGNARGKRLGSGRLVFLHAPFSKSRFLIDFARRESLLIWYEGKVITRLPLSGSKEAASELVRCQRNIEIARKRASPRDPFAKGTVPATNDPFR